MNVNKESLTDTEPRADTMADTDPDGTPDRSDVRAALGVLGVLVVAAALARPLLLTLAGALLYGALAAGLLWWTWTRFRHLLPFQSDQGFRVVVITVLLIPVLMLMSSLAGSGSGGGPMNDLPMASGGLEHLAYFSAISLLIGASVLLGEVFLRGVIYSLLLEWKGHGLATVGSAAAFAGLMVLAAPGALQWGAAVLFSGLVLAGSRWITKSLTPALVAQGLLGLSQALFVLLVGIDGLGG